MSLHLAGACNPEQSPTQTSVGVGDPLGINTKFTSAAQQSGKPRYDLLDTAQELLPGERVQICHRHKIPDTDHVQVFHNPVTGKARYGALMKCKSIWSCPFCAAKITEERRVELRNGLSTCTNRMVLITYTLRHSIDDPLYVLLKGLKKAFGKMRSGRKWQNIKALYGVIGGILSTEVTYGEHGWHVHRHELLLLPDDISDDELSNLESLLKSMWLNALQKCDLSATWDHGLDMNTDPALNREYVAKFGRDPILDEWTVAHELTKAPIKKAHGKGKTPWQLLDLASKGDIDAAILFREYALTFKGSKQLHYSDGLREYLKMNPEIDDQDLDLDETEIDEILLYEINPEIWREICRLRLRGAVLDVAQLGNASYLDRFITMKTGLKCTRIDLTLIC